MFKFLVWHALIVAASCELFKEESGYVLNYAPVYNTYKPRDYQFNYAVSDPHTGDHKSQWEVKTNGVVRGGYSLLEPDGTTRIVEYVADDDGFRAVVNKVGTAIHPVSALVPQVPPVSHYRAYDGQVANYIPQLQEPTILPQIEQNQGVINVNHGGTEGVVLDQSHVNTLPTAFIGGNVAADQSLGVVPSYNIDGIVGTVQGGVPVQGHNIEGARLVSGGPALGTVQQIPLQEYSYQQPNLKEVPGQVPLQGYNIQQNLAVAREEIPLQPTGIEPQSIQGHNLGVDTIQLLQRQELRPEVVPNIQGHSLPPTGVEASLPVQSEVPVFQGHLQQQVVPVIRQDNLGLLNFGRGNISPLQGQLARIQSYADSSRVVPQNVAVQLQRENFGGSQQGLPQPQIEILGSRGVLSQVPELVPVDPSYQTVIDYHGLGNQGLQNDNRLKKDVYHSSYSEKVLKVVPAPRKGLKKVKKEFLIYYPEH